ncbi:MAG TPA: hypothetical protein VFC46_09395 [Humisphaera sp.]|nr:hypothetical protein [Humisphaera sp.]
MIRFSCRCGYVFEAPEDAVGIGLQCPECHLLNDVPMLGDLANIAGDGTYKIGVEQESKPPETLGNLLEVYGSSRVDDTGKAIDLRTSPNDFDDIGEYETIDDVQKRQRPRYDPETGELVTAIPLDKVHDKTVWIDPSTIPFAKTIVNYAADDATRARSPFRVLRDLARPTNLVAMGFVLGIHAFLGFWTIAIAMGLLLAFPFILASIVALIAHYGNVVDEIGPGGQDELPRVMRDLQLREDVWHPFSRIAITAAICYGPAILFARHSSISPASTAAVAAAMAIAGTFFMPALLLTFLTSGSPVNLRPDRILGVIHICGARYFFSIAIFVASFIFYLWGIVGFSALAYKSFGASLLGLPHWAIMFPISFPLMCLGIFGMHYFCWELGILYRTHGRAFPWVDQYHIHVPRPPVRRRKPKYVSAPSAGESEAM